jgi:RNase H-like domain found in reverse transcriptase
MKEQRNYDTGDRELLAIVWALKEWRHYIQGSGHTMIVLSDHCYDFDTKQVSTVKYFQVSSITSFKFKDNSECLLLGIV